MSDHIPFELQVEIIKKLPIKSLIQFRSVSKAWKAQIDSSDFIAGYNNQRQHLLVICWVLSDTKYVSFVDDDTFPQQKVSLTLPPSVADLAKHGYFVGSSHGLICFYAHYSNRGSGMAFLWNPSIRKAVRVVVPNPGNDLFEPYLGFGVCRETTDLKIVNITHTDNIVEVFALSEGVWRCPYNSFPSCLSIEFGSVSVLIDGVLYWLATGSTSDIGSYRLIISFDITSEEFREVNIPESLAQSDRVKIFQLKGSLVVLEHYYDDRYFDVWMMEDGVSNSFTKLYGICTADVYARVFSGVRSVLAFRKSGEAIIEIIDYRREQLKDRSDEEERTIAVYDPYSKQIDDLGIVGNTYTFGGYPYIETLLLLDQPDSLIYDQGKRYVSKRRAKKRRILKHKGKV